ncbi:LPS assembly lipoprotein LptE [Variovorax sp. J2P1-59]|uniref:LPS-assembly lipoprotein LptE n=1 Tax=Variovorax flavidus TaxID=3053501 RepID=UPI0025755537|nr:LPS assembly lipoprotein LptE [Variovorax sp. J2P1-59]MDM0074939.1 LPS assembly lipoprotein LptE [Variovorax sp. J2P1-59]
MSSRTALPRRGFLALGAASLALAGCGFQLRKAPDFAFNSIAVPGNTAFANYLRRNLRAAGTVEVLPADQADKAEAVFEILGENRDSVVISTNASGQVRELNLRLTIRFRVRGQGGKELMGPTAIQQTRDITYNETAALAKEGESELLYRDMQTDIAQQILRRLAAIKPA